MRLRNGPCRLCHFMPPSLSVPGVSELRCHFLEVCSLAAFAEFRARAAAKRSALFRQFAQSFDAPIRVIDLGGTVSMWERWGLDRDVRLRIDLANNFPIDVNGKNLSPKTNNISKIDVDVVTLTPSDYKQYDVVFSNSMLEHLTSTDQQRSVAQAVVQSGRPYFIQVPNKHSLIDPHFAHPLAPFFAAWPRYAQARALRLSALGSGSRARSIAHAERRLEYYNPLSIRDLAALFSGGSPRIVVERTFGIPMSLVAMWRSDTRGN
jgi:hypothetical protein